MDNREKNTYVQELNLPFLSFPALASLPLSLQESEFSSPIEIESASSIVELALSIQFSK